MSSHFKWDDPQFAGEYITWAEGVEVIGEVTLLDTHQFEANDRGPGRVVPKVVVNVDGHNTEITCGPADLRKKMIAAKPGIGDRIKISVIGSTKTQVGTQFFFRVDVQRSSNTAGINSGRTDGVVVPEVKAPVTSPMQDEVPF